MMTCSFVLSLSWLIKAVKLIAVVVSGFVSMPPQNKRLHSQLWPKNHHRKWWVGIWLDHTDAVVQRAFWDRCWDGRGWHYHGHIGRHLNVGNSLVHCFLCFFQRRRYVFVICRIQFIFLIIIIFTLNANSAGCYFLLPSQAERWHKATHCICMSWLTWVKNNPHESHYIRKSLYPVFHPETTYQNPLWEYSWRGWCDIGLFNTTTIRTPLISHGACRTLNSCWALQ